MPDPAMSQPIPPELERVLADNAHLMQPRDPNQPEPHFRDLADRPVDLVDRPSQPDLWPSRAPRPVPTQAERMAAATSLPTITPATLETWEQRRAEDRGRITELLHRLTRAHDLLRATANALDLPSEDLDHNAIVAAAGERHLAARNLQQQLDRALAELEQAQRQALTAASNLLWSWAEEMGDVGGTGPRAIRKRTIKACARKIAPEPTDDEMRAALAEVLAGMATRAKGSTAPSSVPLRRAQEPTDLEESTSAAARRLAGELETLRANLADLASRMDQRGRDADSHADGCALCDYADEIRSLLTGGREG